ncbi:phage tail protein [Clostridium botulinum]|nr:phage tail protein [Clostridium botulinum]KEI75868.1 hypothetical protein N486_08835 [Clostridium botulinum B2 128]KEI92014.1 hypothetical protein N491_08985 [Clostridium botulinum B2 275]
MAITNQGMALYAKAQAGQEIHFTKMQVGSGQIETQNPVTLLALLDPKLDVPITSITANPEMKSATIIGNITNKDVTEATYICELGLFAKDPDEGEILYGYVSAGQYGDYYAPEAQGPYSWQYEINAAIGNAANVTAEVSRLNWDHSVINSNKTFLHLQGGNQKEINKSIDTLFESVKSDLAGITTDKNRLTADKTITGAINELFTNANNGKKLISDVVGNPLLATDTFQQQHDKIQILKNTFVTNLSKKEQGASSTENLQDLISKINNINVGKKWAEGTGKARESSNKEVCMSVTDLDFSPKTVIINTRSDTYREPYIAIDCTLFKYKTQGWYSGGYIILDDGYVHKNNRGFDFYASNGHISKDTTFQWIAFE